MNSAILYLLISVAGGATGQLLLKKGMSTIGPLTLSVDRLGTMLWQVGTNFWVVAGLFVYVFSTAFWLVVLSRMNLSYAYPFVSLSYIIMIVASWQLFNENISLLRVLGSLVVALGVFLVSRS